MFRRLSRSSKNWSCRLDEEGGQSIGDKCKSSNYSVERRPDTGSGGGFRSINERAAKPQLGGLQYSPLKLKCGKLLLALDVLVLCEHHGA